MSRSARDQTEAEKLQAQHDRLVAHRARRMGISVKEAEKQLSAASAAPEYLSEQLIGDLSAEHFETDLRAMRDLVYPTLECLDPADIVKCLAGRVSPQIEAHLAACVPCRRLLDAARLSDDRLEILVGKAREILEDAPEAGELAGEAVVKFPTLGNHKMAASKRPVASANDAPDWRAARFAAAAMLLVTLGAGITRLRQAWRDMQPSLAQNSLKDLSGSKPLPDSLSVSYDRLKYAFPTTDGKIHIFDKRLGEQIASFDPDSTQVRVLGFSKDGKFFITADPHNAISVWDVYGSTLALQANADPMRIRELQVSKDGSNISILGVDGQSALWRLPNQADKLESGGDRQAVRVSHTETHNVMGGWVDVPLDTPQTLWDYQPKKDGEPPAQGDAKRP